MFDIASLRINFKPSSRKCGIIDCTRPAPYLLKITQKRLERNHKLNSEPVTLVITNALCVYLFMCLFVACVQPARGSRVAWPPGPGQPHQDRPKGVLGPVQSCLSLWDCGWVQSPDPLLHCHSNSASKPNYGNKYLIYSIGSSLCIVLVRRTISAGHWGKTK